MLLTETARLPSRMRVVSSGRFEPAGVDALRHNVFCRSGQYGLRDQAAHQEPGDAGFPVGKAEPPSA